MDFEDQKFLIAQLKKGEELAYVYLLDKYHRRLYAYALTLINNEAFAQDIVQTVFLKTWQFREKMNSKYSLQSFLFTSVYNEFINTYKKNQAVSLLEKEYFESLANVVDNVDENVIDKMISMIATEAQNLPPKCRKIFTLSKKEGLTNLEIAEHLNISIKTVEAQITKAFGILHNKLKKNFEAIFFFFIRYGLKKSF